MVSLVMIQAFTVSGFVSRSNFRIDKYQIRTWQGLVGYNSRRFDVCIVGRRWLTIWPRRSTRNVHMFYLTLVNVFAKPSCLYHLTPAWGRQVSQRYNNLGNLSINTYLSSTPIYKMKVQTVLVVTAAVCVQNVYAHGYVPWLRIGTNVVPGIAYDNQILL